MSLEATEQQLRPGLAVRFWNRLRSRDGMALAGLFFVAIVYGFTMEDLSLFEPDEGRYAEIPREMLHTGDFVTPHLEGVVYLEKPPLHYWLNAISIRLLGRTNLAPRLSTLLSGLFGALLVMLLGRHMFGAREGRRGALILVTSPLYFALFGINIIDMTLTFLMSMTLAFFWWAHEAAHESQKPRKWLWHVAFAFAALTVLTKGLVGIVLPAGVVFLYLAISRRLRDLARVPWISGMLVFLVIAVPWHVLIARQTPGFVDFYFVQEHLLRYTTGRHERSQPIWYFLPVLALGMLPWTGFLAHGVAGLELPSRVDRWRFNGHEREQRALLFLALWCVVIVGFFSLSNSKLIPYVLPATPALALLMARGTTRAGSGRGLPMVAQVVFLLISVLLLMASIGLIHLDVDAEVTPAVAGLCIATVCLIVWNMIAEAQAERVVRVERLLAATACFCFAILFSASQVAEYRTTETIANCVLSHAQPGDEIFAYNALPQTLPYYLDQTIGIVAFPGEIRYGIERLPDDERSERFPSLEQFLPRWKSDQRFYLVVEQKSFDQALSNGLSGRPVCESDRYRVLTNLPASTVVRQSHQISHR